MAKFASRDSLVKLFHAFYAEQQEVNEDLKKALTATDAKIPSVKCEDEILVIATNESEAEITN